LCRVRGDTTSDGLVAGAADHRGVSLDLGSSLSGARQRPRLRTRLHLSGEGDGYPRSADLSRIAVAEWNCGVLHRHAASRVPGPNDDLWRGAPAANSFLLCEIQSNAHASGFAERFTATTACTTDRRYSRPSRATSPIRPDMIFGKDTTSGASVPPPPNYFAPTSRQHYLPRCALRQPGSACKHQPDLKSDVYVPRPSLCCWRPRPFVDHFRPGELVACPSSYGKLLLNSQELH
jgi:hypothetical protein